MEIFLKICILTPTGNSICCHPQETNENMHSTVCFNGATLDAFPNKQWSEARLCLTYFSDSCLKEAKLVSDLQMEKVHFLEKSGFEKKRSRGKAD